MAPVVPHVQHGPDREEKDETARVSYSFEALARPVEPRPESFFSTGVPT